MFQVIIANGGTINCSWTFHNIKITMGEYLVNIPMMAMQMGGFDVVLGVQWLQSLEITTLHFQ